MKSENQKAILRILSITFAVGLTVILLLNRERIAEMEALGYPGLLVISFLSSATIVLPVPGVLVTASMGAVFNPLFVALAAGLGSALGELTGYLAGYSGQAVVENIKVYDQMVGWMKRYGDLTILVLAFIPNPLFDMAGIAAGMLRVPVYRFFFWCLAGKILKMLVFAYGGMALGGILPR